MSNHVERDCRFKQQSMTELRERFKNRKHRNYSIQQQEQETEEFIWVGSDDPYVFLTTTAQFQLILDSGATVHILSNRALFQEYSPCTNTFITVADGGRLQVAGIGNASITTFDERRNAVSIQIRQAYHVPTSQVNLISLSRLLKAKDGAQTGWRFTATGDG